MLGIEPYGPGPGLFGVAVMRREKQGPGEDQLITGADTTGEYAVSGRRVYKIGLHWFDVKINSILF